METNRNSVTIYDIAKETGLAASTVSRIINKKGKYSDETIRKVTEAINRLGYIPNTRARHLASGSTNTIAIALPFVSNGSLNNFSFYNMFILGVIDNLNHYHFNMLLYNPQNITDSGANALLFNQHDFDGIIFPGINSGIIGSIPHLLSSGMPFVFAGDGSDIIVKEHNIYGGYYLYAQEVLRIFYDKGYRNIVLFYSFMNDPQYSRMKSLLEAFQAAHEQENFTCRLCIYTPDDTFQFCTIIDGYINSPSPPDGFFINSADFCITAYNHLQKAGYRIPEDIAIIGTAFSTTTGSEFSPALSTIYVNAYEMGYRSVDLLFNQIYPEQNKIVDEYVPFRYIDRDSTC